LFGGVLSRVAPSNLFGGVKNIFFAFTRAIASPSDSRCKMALWAGASSRVENNPIVLRISMKEVDR